VKKQQTLIITSLTVSRLAHLLKYIRHVHTFSTAALQHHHIGETTELVQVLITESADGPIKRQVPQYRHYDNKVGPVHQLTSHYFPKTKSSDAT